MDVEDLLTQFEEDDNSNHGYVHHVTTNVPTKANECSGIFHAWNGERFKVTVQKLADGSAFGLDSGKEMSVEEYKKLYSGKSF